MRNVNLSNKVVLVGVLKRKHDLTTLFNEHWYHMPLSHAPRRTFHYLAWYQPSLFGRQGKCIRYYSRVVRVRRRRRRDILSRETAHPRADEKYQQIYVSRIQKLPRPIRNIPPRRISFGFTTLGCLRSAKNILELYRVFPAEQVVERALEHANIPVIPQYRVSGGRRYRLDFAIPCRRGYVAIECDNTKAHTGAFQRLCDRNKDIFLRRHGWTVVRLAESMIVADIRSCIALVRRAVDARGGALK